MGAVSRDTLTKLDNYYKVIKQNALLIDDYRDKQTFLKVIYEDFYKIYNPKAADKLGIVYTPNEIVKFQIESVDYLLEKHFKTSLNSKKVKILDPCTGTGTYICELIDYLSPLNLADKYKNDIYVNELELLPYYIANLNIEYTYQQKMGGYVAFDNICWVDTLDNTGTLKETNTDLFGLSIENTKRIKEQNKVEDISVIIGNPPYNANQQNENDNNKNCEYKEIDSRIKATYIKESNAQKTKLYDPYARFYRWASDRISEEQGIIAFVTNNSFINTKTFDGFRKCISREFDFAYIVDLKGDVRNNYGKNLKISNVFDIQTGVSLMFLVKENNENEKKCKIFYTHLNDEMPKSDKLNWLESNKLEKTNFEIVTPDKNNNWINQTDNDFDCLVSVCNKEVKLHKSQESIFRLFSLGVVTNRDEWLYDFNKKDLIKKIKIFINTYNSEIKRWNKSDNSLDTNDFVDRTIKWTSELETHLTKNHFLKFDKDCIISSLYRPYIKKFLYFDKIITHRIYQNESVFGFKNKYENIAIWFKCGMDWDFFAAATKSIHDILPQGGSNCLPLYVYDTEGKQHENITDWALTQFKNQYPTIETLSKLDIFHYVYAVLHNPEYRKKYELNLKRDFPRIPFYENFAQWAEWGKQLMELHLNYETAAPFPLERHDLENAKIPKAKLKADKANGLIILDDNTTLSGVPLQAWDYKLGNRSALEWILDQYKEKKPKDPTIAEKFNNYRFADYKEQVIDLLKRVCTVSVETVKIVDLLRTESNQHAGN